MSNHYLIVLSWCHQPYSLYCHLPFQMAIGFPLFMVMLTVMKLTTALITEYQLPCNYESSCAVYHIVMGSSSSQKLAEMLTLIFVLTNCTFFMRVSLHIYLWSTNELQHVLLSILPQCQVKDIIKIMQFDLQIYCQLYVRSITCTHITSTRHCTCH